jgi:AraC-like DNA-binding protein
LLDAAIEASDSRDAGQEAMLAKLSELMFVEALRAHIDGLPPEIRSWVAGLRDPEVGSALRLIHGRFAEPWSLERLAREVSMSRSSFADRFTVYVGVPPMTYLARWRLQVAARMLQNGSLSVAQAASTVGYQSESAFNRAFKRQVGRPPGTWRRRDPALEAPGDARRPEVRVAVRPGGAGGEGSALRACPASRRASGVDAPGLRPPTPANLWRAAAG